MKLSQRAAKSIVSQTQTYSKQACRYVEGVYPEYASHASGPFLYEEDGSRYVDFVCALGTNVLGYSHPAVNEAVIRQIQHGTLYSIPNRLEIQLAETIKRLIPSMELMRFLKSGSEAVSAGVKIARAYTGKDRVFSAGYHGWHDWSTPITRNNAGTPEAMFGTVTGFEYNDLNRLKRLFDEFPNEVACVVIDPFVFDDPVDGFLDKLIKLAHKNKALVLFDEVVTGIRWSKFSVQNTYSVKPDLTALGKALANGFAISCIGGKKEVMRMLDKDCFVSSTYGGDLVGISAAIATLEIMEAENVQEMLQETGTYLMDGINELSHSNGLDIVVDGSPFRQRVSFPSVEHKALFWQECVKRGVFFGGAQHTSYAHKIEILDRALARVDDAMGQCKLYWGHPRRALEGKLPVSVATVASLRGKNG